MEQRAVRETPWLNVQYARDDAGNLVDVTLPTEQAPRVGSRCQIQKNAFYSMFRRAYAWPWGRLKGFRRTYVTKSNLWARHIPPIRILQSREDPRNG